MITRTNPHIYTPPQEFATPDEARAHIAGIDEAISLCIGLLDLSCTRRLTATQGLKVPFLRTEDEEETPSEDDFDDFYSGKSGKCGYLHNHSAEGKRE